MPPETQNQVVGESKVSKPPVFIIVLLVVAGLIGSLQIFSGVFLKPSDTETLNTDWKTYRNDQYGFEFKYPKDWHVAVPPRPKEGSLELEIDNDYAYQIHNDPMGGSDLPNSIVMSVYPSLLDLTGEQSVGLLEYLQTTNKIGDKKPYKILYPIDGYKISAGPNEFGGGEYYFLQNNDRIFKIWTFHSEIEKSNDSKAVLQILSTFKFTSTSTDTTELLRECPDEWIENAMPPGYEEYYILRGERMGLSEFDNEWVVDNCNLEKQGVY